MPGFCLPFKKSLLATPQKRRTCQRHYHHRGAADVKANVETPFINKLPHYWSKYGACILHGEVIDTIYRGAVA